MILLILDIIRTSLFDMTGSKLLTGLVLCPTQVGEGGREGGRREGGRRERGRKGGSEGGRERENEKI